MIIRKKRWILLLFGADLLLAGFFLMQGSTMRQSYTQVSAVLPAQCEVAAEEKRIALTFDDGPNANYTLPLLDGLKERGVKATFFLIGQEVTENPEIAKRIAKDGHLIGNHSFYHVDLCKLEKEEVIYQVSRTNEVIYAATGQYPQLIRPPFGRGPEDIIYEPPMLEVLWTIDSRDWELSDVGTIFQNVVPEAKSDAIILMHDASASSVQAAFSIVDCLQERGYTFVTLDELLFD